MLQRTAWIWLFVLTLWVVPVMAQQNQQQQIQLANQYYFDGEYEKAATLFEKLYLSNKGQDYFLNRYVECLISLERYTDAERTIQEGLKSQPKNVQLYVTFGNMLERQGIMEQAKQKFQQAVDNLPAEKFRVIQLANQFMGMAKYDYAIATYEKGKNILKEKADLSYYLAELYRLKGATTLMIEHYLLSLEEIPERLQQIKSLFQRYLAKEDMVTLQSKILSQLQGKPDVLFLNELLSWSYIQQKDYERALRQERAMDKRLEENGTRVYNLGEIAYNAGDYETAIKAFEYILTDKGPASTYFFESKRKALEAKRRRLMSATAQYSKEDLLTVEKEYEEFLDLIGRNKNTAMIIMDLAELQALYINNLDKAIKNLKELVEYTGLNRFVQGNAKIQLADYYLIKGERWESTLLYSQVDKAFKEEEIGEQARYKNARLAYFTGDFEWAQKQFDILKASTSKLIANDALDLSVFIMDNLGLDTSAGALQMYADAELLSYQNLDQQALAKLDSLPVVFPQHSLADDVLYLKGRIYEKFRQWDRAINAYNRIIEEYREEIRADNAMFNLASLYHYQLNDLPKAQELYEKIFIDFSNSTFAVEARKRFRQLRGDLVQ